MSCDVRASKLKMAAMKPLLFVVALALAAPAAFAADLPDPIAPAMWGQLQCYMPDTARKTCASLAGYRANPAGGIDNATTVLLSKSPVVTMETISPIEIKMGQVCGKIRRQDLDSATFTMAGRPFEAQQAAPIRAQLQTAFQNIFDHEICTAYTNQGAAMLAKATIDGVPTPPAADQQVLWVSPADGYTVSP